MVNGEPVLDHMMTHPEPMSKKPARPAPLAWVDDAPFYQAGLAGYSDTAMRLVARKHGCPYCVTEALLDRLLVNGGRGLRPALLDETDHPIAGQLMGSHPDEIAQGAQILLGMGYDVIDINLACPVKKVRRKSRGGYLLCVPDEAIAILRTVAEEVGDRVPLTVKLRRGYDDTAESEAGFHRILASAIDLGYAAATVHGRTVRQKYVGPARWAFLADLARRYRDAMQDGFLLFGSGDIDSPQAIFRMIEQTGVNGVSVARGCIGNPWIFHQARQFMSGQPITAPTLDEQRSVLAEHFELSVRQHGESLAGRLMRKFGIKFSQHHPRGDVVAKAFIDVKSLDDWLAVLDEYYPEPGTQHSTGVSDHATTS